MDNQIVMQALAESTISTLIFGVLIGSLFSIATLAIFDAIKLARANCGANCTDDAKQAPKAAAKSAPAKTVAKTPVKKAAAKPAPKAVAKPAAKKAVAKKSPAKKKK